MNDEKRRFLYLRVALTVVVSFLVRYLFLVATDLVYVTTAGESVAL